MANFHSINGNEIEAHYAGGDLREEIDLKADSDGYYTMLTAGAADNLTARGDGVTASYLYRTTGGSASFPDDAEATVRSIKGRTLGWNQIVHNNNTGATNAGITFTNNSDGSWTVNGTASADAFRYMDNPQRQDLIVGHKYLAKGCPAGGSASTYMYREGWWHTFTDYGDGAIFTVADRRYACTPSIVVANGAIVDNLVFRPQLFDLTAMFGAGNEPATVAEFEALYPLPYYPYDAGTLLPVRMTGVETNGFNQWDEQTAEGIWNDNGTISSSSAYICCKNKIPVFPGQTYYIQRPAAVTNVYMKGYDADGINGISLNLPDTNLLTIPDGVYFIVFAVQKSQYGTIYNNDICINLSWSGYRNGEYEQYWSEQRIIAAIAENFPDGMRSVGTDANMVCDELTEHEAIHRVGEVDLGTLDWTYDSTYATPFFHAPLAGLNMATNSEAMKSALYTAKSGFWGTAGNDMCIASGGTYLNVSNSAYTDAAAFKAAMSGVMLHYALATPTTTTFPQPINMDYRFADFGTERIIVPTGQMSAPPTMDVVYGLNAPDTLRTLPTEYVSKASDASFTAALGAFLNATITRTWNETAGRYDYTITANGE